MDNINHVHKNVAPTRTFMFGSFPCEKQAAAIRNKTLAEIEKKDVSMVAYRYLQSKKAKTNAAIEAVGMAISVIAAPHTLVAIRNNRRYVQTQKICEGYLKMKLGDDFKKIKKLSCYFPVDRNKLVAILKKQNIDVTNLEKKLSNKEKSSSKGQGMQMTI
jgi:hypothetical protein